MKTNFEYNGKTQIEIANEIANEIAGISHSIANQEYNEKDMNYMLLLMQDLMTVKNTKKQTTKKRLNHKSFQKELQTQKINAEIFDLSYTDKRENFNCIACHDRQDNNGTEWAIWVSYEDQKIKLWQDKENKSLVETFKKHYENKGYEIEYTSDNNYRV
jgi:hypothetical protein